MIAIVNNGLDGKRQQYDAVGEHEYSVGINHTVLFTFKHYREDGLAECLYKASDAAAEWEKKENVY